MPKQIRYAPVAVCHRYMFLCFFLTCEAYKCDVLNTNGGIDTINNLVFWSRLANKLEPWHNVYIIQQ